MDSPRITNKVRSALTIGIGGLSGYFGNIAVQNQSDPGVFLGYTALSLVLLGLAILAAWMETEEDAKLKSYEDLQREQTQEILDRVRRIQDQVTQAPAERAAGAPAVPKVETFTTDEMITELLVDSDEEEADQS